MNAAPIRIGEIIDNAKISPYQIAILLGSCRDKGKLGHRGPILLI